MLLAAAGFTAGGVARSWARGLLGRRANGRSLTARLLLAGAWGAVGWRYGLCLQTAELCMLCLVLLTVTLTDVTKRVIPNECLLFATAVRFAYLTLMAVRGDSPLFMSVLQSLAGGACAFVPLLAMALAMDRLTGIESLGGGDLKLLTVVGFYVGSERLPIVLLLACLCALVWAMLPVLHRQTMRRTFPFGPSISLAVLAVLIAEPHVEGWLATVGF